MNGFIEGYLDLRVQIVAPIRESRTGKSISAAKAMEAGTAKASAARPSFAAKHISKQITEDIIPVAALKMELMIRSIPGTEGSGPVCSSGTIFEAAKTTKSAKTTGTCSGALSVTCRLIKGSMSELVVKLLLLWITQNVVSLIYILKHLLRRLIARIGIRMILLC